MSKTVSLGPRVGVNRHRICVTGLRIGVNRLRDGVNRHRIGVIRFTIGVIGSIYHLESDAGVSKALNCLVSQKAEDCWSTSATCTVSTTPGSPPCCPLLIHSAVQRFLD